MEFKDIGNEKKQKSVKKTPIEKIKGKEVLINDVIFIFDAEDKEENYDNLKTLQDVIALDIKKPNLLLGISPSLYSAFKSSVTKNIETYIDKGDTVIYKNISFSPDKKNLPKVVENVIIKSLGNMSVIIAEFEGGDFALTTHLKRVS